MVLALQASAGNAAVTRLVGPPHADHHARAPNRTTPQHNGPQPKPYNGYPARRPNRTYG